MISVTYNASPLVLVLVVVTMLTACTEIKNGEHSMPAKDKVTVEEWKVISQKRILFGHQSVGENILSGIKILASQDGTGLQIIESRNSSSEYGITHFKIGKNEDPRSKIQDFTDTLNRGAARNADVALMKLCYIDINVDTDARKLAEDYRSSLDQLSQKYPQTLFIAVTVPLRTVQDGPKALVKRLFGQYPGGYADNFRRQEFNTILRNIYGAQGRLFDLAKLESEGTGSHYYQGQLLEVMNPAISDDGGHLNAYGEGYIATKLLKFIAAISTNS